MRSGLKFSEVYANFSSDVIEMLFNQPDAARYAARQPLDFAPGTTLSYASGTSNILSAIVRRVVGEPDYWDWPRRVLFDPLGMTSAILEPDASGTLVCSSFMLATAHDWARFGQLFLQDGVRNGGADLPDGWVSFSTTPTAESTDDTLWRSLVVETSTRDRWRHPRCGTNSSSTPLSLILTEARH